MLYILPDCVGSTLKPVRVIGGLLRRQNIHEAAAEHVELVGLDDMLVQRGGIELSQDEYLVHIGIQTVADRDINDPVLAGQRHGRLASHLSQRIEALASASAHDDAQYVLLHDCSSRACGRIIKEIRDALQRDRKQPAVQ